MTSLVIGSVKGSPGVTTAALAIAASWPVTGREPPMVAELDPAGGDIAAWYDLPSHPGLVSLAPAARRGLHTSTVMAHCQVLPGGLRVLIGMPSPTRTAAALRLLKPDDLVAALDRPAGLDVVVDAGRLGPGSPVLPALQAATVTLLLLRPVAAEVLHVATQMEDLRAAASTLGVVVVGNGPYPAREVADTLRLELFGALPVDRTGAAILAGRGGTARALARSELMRAARVLGERVATRSRPAMSATDPGEKRLARAVESVT